MRVLIGRAGPLLIYAPARLAGSADGVHTAADTAPDGKSRRRERFHDDPAAEPGADPGDAGDGRER